MRIIVTGGTGLIGRALCGELIRGGHQVVVLSRDPARDHGLPAGVDVVRWTGRSSEGWGHLVLRNADGSTPQFASIHGEGGLERFAAMGNLDDDPALEIVLPLWPEYRAIQTLPSGRLTYERLTPSNVLWALDGADGSVQWIFEGEYINNFDPERMFDPIMVDVTGDGLLDVLAISNDRHLYAIHGATGEKLMEYFFYLTVPYHSIHLTFVPDGDRGIVLFTSLRRGAFYTLNALQISERVAFTP